MIRNIQTVPNSLQLSSAPSDRTSSDLVIENSEKNSKINSAPGEASSRIPAKISALEFLVEFGNSFKQRTGQQNLKLVDSKITWQIYFDAGKVIYATNSISPFERLERHLRRSSHDAPLLKDKAIIQACLNFSDATLPNLNFPAEYQAIAWLVTQNYILPAIATKLIMRMTQEALECFSLIDLSSHTQSVETLESMPVFGRVEPLTLNQSLQKRLQSWQSLASRITSPYQRPYFVSEKEAKKLVSAALLNKLAPLMKGFNFHQLAVLLNKDELAIAQKLYVFAEKGVVVLRDPLPPFDVLSRFVTPPSVSVKQQSDTLLNNLKEEDLGEGNGNSVAQKTWKIACIDDSDAMLGEISRFLSGDEFQVHTINDSMRALLKLTTIKPDLILMDVGMPNVDGYMLCSLIRKSSALKDTPVVMVTGNKGLIDRAKAKLVGANDYLTKPFNQTDLLNIAFRYLY
jgi:two-component system, chemotaxis family, response regulator PixG